MSDQGKGRRIGRNAIPLASVLILACLLATSWITFDRVNKLLDAKDRVAHTYKVKVGLEAVFGAVAAAESDQRAYILTLNKALRERYERSQSAVHQQIEDMRRITVDNPDQRGRLNRLQETVDARYTYMAGSTRERDRNGLSRTIELLQDGAGVRTMNDIRSIITEMTNAEGALLAKRQAEAQGQTVQAEISFALSLAISFVLISTFGVLSNRLVVLRDEAAEEERGLRSNLEREVERTKAAEVRLEATMRELKRSNEELQNFAFVASHDLQEPLRKIRAFSDRVSRRAGGVLDAESKDSLLRVESAAERMQRLILDLLELSRITTKARPHVRVDLNQAVDEIVDDLQARLEETGGEVMREALPSVVVEPAQLRHLLQNLIANALKFRRDGIMPIVRIKGETRADGRISIEISDNGIGFEEKYADRIFVVFQRLHGRGEYEGSGIGLAIVRKIVERHGGQIEALGKPGEGATFRFDLPGEPAAAPQNAIVDGAESNEHRP